MKGREPMFANLFSHKQYRQLELIDYVLKQPEEFTSFIELQKKFDITERVLRRDLHEIQELCDQQLEINIVHELVSIKFKQIASYDEVFRMFARDTITFQLFDDIIFQRFENVTDLFNQYYISRSTGYRYLNELNDFFESHHIEVEISKNPLTLVGNELAVRTLIPHFLTMYYHVDECPFYPFNMQQIHQIYRALASRFSYLEIFSNDRTFYYDIASNIDRTLQGHQVPTNQWQLDSSYWIINHPEQKYPHTLVQTLKEIRLEPTDSNIEQVLVGICNNQVIVNSDHLNLKMAQDEEFAYQVIEFYNQLDDISQKYNIQKLTLGEKNFLVIMGYNLMAVRVSPPNILNRKRTYSADNFFDLLNQLSSSFYEDARQVMVQFFLPFNNGKNIYEQNLILFYLMSYWPDLIMQLRKHQHKPNILVFLENVAAGRQFQHFLQSTNMHDTNVQLVTNPIEFHECTMQDWDIVISDYELRQIRCRFFVGVDGIPTNAHVNQINRLIKLLRSSDGQHTVEESPN